MRIIVISLMSLFLMACASKDSRYQDNASLERPPEIAIDKQAAEQATATQATVNEFEPPKRRHGKGLKSDVYVVDGSPKELKVKRTFDEVWGLLHQAIQHNDLKVTDQDRSKGIFYVVYNGNGFLGKAVSYFNDEYDRSVYLLKVDPQEDETTVTASLANKDEQNPPKRDSEENPDDDTPVHIHSDKSENLIELLYDTLHDDLKDE